MAEYHAGVGTENDNSRSLAWNGIELRVPAGWEPALLEKHYLRAAGQEGRSLECKWQEGKSVSRKKALQRLQKALKGVESQMGGQGLPPEVRQALKALEKRGFEAVPFSWKSEAQQAAGALLQCGVCGRSTLVQCVGAEEAPEEAGAMLRSFADHREDGGVLYELFGIQALLPRGFTLKSFSFTPGQYRLVFEGDKARRRAGLMLERVGPASVLLKDESFGDWALQRFAPLGEGGGLKHETWQGGAAAIWRPQRRGLAGMLWRLGSRRKLAHVRAWHPAGANSVLCVALTGGGRGAEALFEEVCRSYALAEEA